MKKRIWIAVLVLLLDQWSKVLTRTMTAPVTLLPGVVRLHHYENTGMAFSMLSGRPWLLGVISLVLVAVGWWILRRYQLGAWSGTASMLMLGGAIGNAIDRLWHGSVTDMIELLFVRFAVFNVADMALTVGCLLMAMTLLVKPKEWQEKELNEHG